jgi:hypothetical protein
MVSADSEPVFGILTLQPSCSPFSDAAADLRSITAIGRTTEAFALQMGGTAEDRPSRHNVNQQQRGLLSDFRPQVAEHAPTQTLQSGSSTRLLGEPSAGLNQDGTGAVPSCQGSHACEEGSQVSRYRCSSYDASIDWPEHRSTQGTVRRTTLFRHSTSNIPNPSLPFPATRQQKLAAITALNKPLQVVTKEKSLIRCGQNEQPQLHVMETSRDATYVYLQCWSMLSCGALYCSTCLDY